MEKFTVHDGLVLPLNRKGGTDRAATLAGAACSGDI